MANPIVTSLTEYVEEHKLPLIAKSVLGAKSAKLLNLMTGVKGKTKLNLVDTDIVLQNAEQCGFNASGSTELSQRELNPAYLKVNHTWCDKNLLKTWANYQVKIAAGTKTLPFEEDFINGVADGINDAMEKMIWQGTSGATSFDGFITILSGSSAITVSEASGTSAYQAIKDVYMAAPQAVLKDDFVIFVSDGIFRAYIQELVAGNMYHYNANDVDGEYKLPGTNHRVIAVGGLDNTANYDYIIGARLSNLYYGTDMEGDEEKFDFWYSKDDQIFKLVAEWISGVQVAYPDEVVFGTIAK